MHNLRKPLTKGDFFLVMIQRTIDIATWVTVGGACFCVYAGVSGAYHLVVGEYDTAIVRLAGFGVSIWAVRLGFKFVAEAKDEQAAIREVLDGIEED